MILFANLNSKIQLIVYSPCSDKKICINPKGLIENIAKVICPRHPFLTEMDAYITICKRVFVCRTSISTPPDGPCLFIHTIRCLYTRWDVDEVMAMKAYWSRNMMYQEFLLITDSCRSYTKFTVCVLIGAVIYIFSGHAEYILWSTSPATRQEESSHSIIFSPPVLMHGGLLGVPVCPSGTGPKVTRKKFKD